MRQYQVARREVVERYFACARCGARGEVELPAVGRSAWQSALPLLDDPIARASDQAERQLRADAERVLALTRCPRCRRRPPGAIRNATVRVAALAAVSIAIAVAFASAIGTVTAFVAGAVGIAIAIGAELARFGRAAGVRFTKHARSSARDA